MRPVPKADVLETEEVGGVDNKGELKYDCSILYDCFISVPGLKEELATLPMLGN